MIDKTQVVAIVLACMVSAVLGVFGLRVGLGYLSCHQRIESLGLGLTPAYDPLTGVCTIRL